MDGYHTEVKHPLLLLLIFALLLCPLKVGGRVWGDDEVLRPSRRSIMTAARQPVARNPAMISVRDIRLDRTFSSAEFGTKMQYPSSWERFDLFQRTFPLTLVTMFLSQEQRPSGIRQNINLIVEDLPSEMTLAEYTDLGIRMERDYFERYALLLSEDILLAGAYRAHRVLFTASLDGGNMTFQQIWMISGRRAYVWTFADSAEAFDDHVMTFERMMDTITVQR